MIDTIEAITTVDQLEDLLSEPTPEVVNMMRRLQGDILLLGVGGKIGPSLARMAKRASELAGTPRRVIGVSRFSDPAEIAKLHACGVETIRCDLLDESGVAALPDAPNIIYLAGLKFGSAGREAAAWAMNTYMPGAICRKFPASRIVAFSTGAVYGLAPVKGGGSREHDPLLPVGEYAMSCVGRERIFEYFSQKLLTPVALIRLFYAAEMRYGVLVDLAQKIAAGEPIDLGMGYFNVIWQGDANAMTLLALERAASPAVPINVTGLEMLSARRVAERLGQVIGEEPIFIGTEQNTACIGNAIQAHQWFGTPQVTIDRLIDWTGEWIRQGGETLGKPTHFEVRDGRY
jgi:nucleoside-diphosphate-sugar epimerase